MKYGSLYMHINYFAWIENTYGKWWKYWMYLFLWLFTSSHEEISQYTLYIDNALVVDLLYNSDIVT